MNLIRFDKNLSFTLFIHRKNSPLPKKNVPLKNFPHVTFPTSFYHEKIVALSKTLVFHREQSADFNPPRLLIFSFPKMHNVLKRTQRQCFDFFVQSSSYLKFLKLKDFWRINNQYYFLAQKLVDFLFAPVSEDFLEIIRDWRKKKSTNFWAKK